MDPSSKGVFVSCHVIFDEGYILAKELDQNISPPTSASPVGCSTHTMQTTLSISPSLINSSSHHTNPGTDSSSPSHFDHLLSTQHLLHSNTSPQFAIPPISYCLSLES